MDEDEYKVEKPICCSVNTFLCTNFLWAFLSVGLLLLGVVGVTVEEGVLVILPPAAYFTAIGIGAFGILVILMGVVGQKQSIELCFLLYILLVSLGLIAQTLAYCYLLLYANDVATISSVDNAAINAQAQFEQNLAAYAAREQDKWRQTQDKLSCCGIDFEAGLAIDAAELALLESGSLCSEEPEATTLADLRAQADGFEGEEFEPAANDASIGSGTGFFCKDRISLIMKENTALVAGVLCALLLAQIAALVSASRMYWVPEYLGGWQFDEAEMGEVAKRKGIELPKTAEDYGGGLGGNFKAATNRLSFRFNNAFTADPNVAPDAGFKTRFSMRRQGGINNNNQLTSLSSSKFGPGIASSDMAAAGFGQPNPANAPPQRPEPPGMFKRLSNRLQPFGGAMMSFPKPREPAGPPPAFRPTEPAGPPPEFARQGSSSGLKRMSARLQSGLASMGGFGAAGGGAPKRPQQPSMPPSFNSQRSFGAPPPPNAGFSLPPPSPTATFGPGRGPKPAPSSFGSAAPSFSRTSDNVPSFSRTSDNVPSFSRASDNVPSFGRSNSNGGMNSGPPPPNTFRQTQFSAPQKTAPPPSRSTGMGGMFGMPRKKSSNVGRPPAASRPKSPMGGGAAGGLLAQIQQGKQLKRTQTNDRSAPKV